MSLQTSATAVYPQEIGEQAKAVHAALGGFGRNLLTVEDPTLDLPVRQLKVCLALFRRSAAMSEISREIGMSPSAVTQVADRLVRRGLVERSLQDEDRRVRKLKLTTKGQRLIRSHETKQLRRIEEALERLTEQQLEQMMAGFNILTRSCQPIQIAEK